MNHVADPEKTYTLTLTAEVARELVAVLDPAQWTPDQWRRELAEDLTEAVRSRMEEQGVDLRDGAPLFVRPCGSCGEIHPVNAVTYFCWDCARIDRPRIERQTAIVLPTDEDPDDLLDQIVALLEAKDAGKTDWRARALVTAHKLGQRRSEED